MKKKITEKHLTHIRNLDIRFLKNVISQISLLKKKQISFIFNIYDDKINHFKEEITRYYFLKKDESSKQIILSSINLILDFSHTTLNLLKEDPIQRAIRKKIQTQFFQYSQTPNLENFLFLLTLYEVSKFHNSKIRVHLKIIKNKIKRIELSRNSNSTSLLLFIEQKFIHSSLEISKKLIIYLRRLRFILQITDEVESVRSLAANGKYIPDIEYHLYLIFQDQLPSIFFKKENKDEKFHLSPKRLVNSTKLSNQFVNDLSKIPMSLDSRGKTTFNQEKNFLLQINPTKLEHEKYFLTKTLAIENSLSLSSQMIQNQIVRELIPSTDRKIIQKTMEYKKFLLNYFLNIQNYFFQFTQKVNISNSILLLYFLTPNYFLEATRLSLFYYHTGKIHFSDKNNQIKVIYPKEFIKLILIIWWSKNILENVTNSQKNDKMSYQKKQNLIMNYFNKNKDSFFKQIFSEIPEAQQSYQQKKTDDFIKIIQKSNKHIEHTIYTRFLGKEYFYLNS